MAARKPRPHESSYYSSGRWHTPQVYLIGWSEHGVMKVGYTSMGRSRYGSFICRGGELLALRTGADAIEAEIRIQSHFSGMWAPAFSSREDAEPLLGGRGGGWTECFKIDIYDWKYAIDVAKEGERDSMVQSR